RARLVAHVAALLGEASQERKEELVRLRLACELLEGALSGLGDVDSVFPAQQDGLGHRAVVVLLDLEARKASSSPGAFLRYIRARTLLCQAVLPESPLSLAIPCKLGCATRMAAASVAIAMCRIRVMNWRACARLISLPPNTSAAASSAITLGLSATASLRIQANNGVDRRMPSRSGSARTASLPAKESTRSPSLTSCSRVGPRDAATACIRWRASLSSASAVRYSTGPRSGTEPSQSSPRTVAPRSCISRMDFPMLPSPDSSVTLRRGIRSTISHGRGSRAAVRST